MAKRSSRRAKRRSKALLAVIVLLVIVIAACACLYFFVFKEEVDSFLHQHFGQQAETGGGTGGETTGPEGGETTDPEGGETTDPEGGETTGPEGGAEIVGGDVTEIASAELSIHFIAPAVKASGDCTLIKAGDTEVLIDAGPTQGNVTAIKDYLEEYCTDGVLEYVIATHADTDHIAGLVGTSSGGKYNGILYSYEIGTIIEFDKTNKSLTTQSGNPTLYARYAAAVDYAEAQGTAVYTGLQCWNGEDGAQRTYYLDEAQTISMNILYNKFYEESSSDENNYSVCMLLSQEIGGSQTNHYLFTGDLEEEGEEALVENNELPQVELYKAGHHGSKTSSTNALLEVIRPKYVAVCCCAGYNEYGAAEENIFPTQAFIDRIAQYTDRVYVTIMLDEETDGYQPMNGNIVFYYGKSEEEEGALKLWCSNNDTILKETAWFQENRTWNGV